MAYSRRNQRLLFISVGLAFGVVAVILMALAFRDAASLFLGPADVAAKTAEGSINYERTFQVGGLVAEGSVEKAGETVTFDVTDGGGTLTVYYTGILPDLFREGQGVVAEGKLQTDGSFIASRILAKHDENYMPREVADTLKEQGLWKDEGQ